MKQKCFKAIVNCERVHGSGAQTLHCEREVKSEQFPDMPSGSLESTHDMIRSSIHRISIGSIRIDRKNTQTLIIANVFTGEGIIKNFYYKSEISVLASHTRAR